MTDESIVRFAGGEIAARRRTLGLTQEDLAELCGMHPTTLGRLERGKCNASIITYSYLYFTLQCGGVFVDRHGVAPLADPQAGRRTQTEVVGMGAAEMTWQMGRQVRQRRCAMELSLCDTASIAGVHRNTLWNLEMGLVSPSMTTYFRVLRALEVSTVTQSGGVPMFA